MSMTATYSPEDNKLRLYSMYRLSKEDYELVKAAGFRWAPKQELFVAPSWSPAREDLLLELCDEIGDEDYSPEERAADRAERFSNYRDKRAGEANGHADTFESGPSAFGHQNRQRAERQAERHDRHRIHAVSQWSKAEYWQSRTAGVIRHALHKSSAAVRRSRILRLEAEQRKHNASIEKAVARWKLWLSVAAEVDADKATRFAQAISGSDSGWSEYKHPRSGVERSLWSHLNDEQDPITGHEAAALALENQHADGPAYAGGNVDRWVQHYELRLTYERAMLAEEGGTVAEVEMEVGGWIGQHQIHGVNKSPATGRVVSVKIFAPPRWSDTGEKVMRSFNIERLPEGAYRAPTDAERAQFQQATKVRKAQEKASKPKEPSLLNPTDDDAERLQAIWNAVAKAKHDSRPDARWSKDFEPTAVLRMTQAEYSARSKGTYSSYETRTLHSCGRPSRMNSNMYTSEGTAYDKSLGEAVCKIRINRHGGWTGPAHIVVITDKPQKTLPLDWEKLLDANPLMSL